MRRVTCRGAPCPSLGRVKALEAGVHSLRLGEEMQCSPEEGDRFGLAGGEPPCG